MKVGIIGFGFVGKALFSGLKNNVEVIKVDPKLKTTVSDLVEFCPDITFISLPTPTNEDGTQDISILREVVDEIKSKHIKTLIVLKSTLLPDSVLAFEKEFDKFVYNPEFLREKTASKDFINSPFIIFGGNRENSKELSNFYENHTLCKTNDYVFLDAVSASIIKYSINSFLATKVIFFNQIFEIFKKSNSDKKWKDVINVISKDLRIGKSHMDVPGHDGRKGFGGSCFPKDISALHKYSQSLNAPLSLLESVININNKIRLSYNDETERKKLQSVKYNDS